MNPNWAYAEGTEVAPPIATLIRMRFSTHGPYHSIAAPSLVRGPVGNTPTEIDGTCVDQSNESFRALITGKKRAFNLLSNQND